MKVNTEYFASRPAEQLVSDLSDQTQEWRKYADRSGLHRKWRRSFRFYYGKHFYKDSSFQESEIIRGGDRGEFAMFPVNHYRNLIKHTLVMTTNQKPAFNPKAINTDPDSTQQARVARNIVDYYFEKNKAGQKCKKAAEQSQVFGKGFIFAPWDPSLGRPHSAKDVTDEDGNPVLDETGQPKQRLVYEGDVRIEVKSPYDVYHDTSAEDFDELEWVNVRCYDNKFNLAAQYPDKAHEILNLPTRSDADQFNFMSGTDSKHSASVPKWYFIHKRTKAMPNGRLVIYCDNALVLYDGPTIYEDKLPLFRIVPGEIFGTTEGYTDFFDCLAIQEATDVLVSIMFTNQQANGIQKIWMPTTGNLTATQLSKGLSLLKSEPGTKPEPLQLTANASEIFQSIPMMQKFMETLSGINSVARGDPEHSLKSGVAVAYVSAMASQYTSAFQQSWTELLEALASHIIWMLQRFGTTERLLEISGKRNKSAITSFTNKDINKIGRISVEVGNPMTQTIAGRLEIAQNLLDSGKIATPQEYIEVLTTGNLDVLTESAESQMDLIRKENDILMDGKPVHAAPGDKHMLHCQEHLSLASDPDLRSKAAMNDPIASKVLSGIFDHIQDHMQKKQTEQPFWGFISGEPPLPPPPPPPGSVPQQNGPPPGMPGPGPAPAQMPGPHGPPRMAGHGGPQHPPQQTQHAPQHPGGPGIAQMMQVGNGMPHIERLPPNLQPGAQANAVGPQGKV